MEFSDDGNPYMFDPDFHGLKPTMFICGNDRSVKWAVREILLRLGW